MSRPQIGHTGPSLVAFCLLENACILFSGGYQRAMCAYLHESSQPLVVGALIRNSEVEFALYDLLRASVLRIYVCLCIHRCMVPQS